MNETLDMLFKNQKHLFNINKNLKRKGLYQYVIKGVFQTDQAVVPCLKKDTDKLYEDLKFILKNINYRKSNKKSPVKKQDPLE